ncbi:cell surface hydrolase, membrane-bound [Fructilactobacillus fructivorans]|nr:cell surface hydrolase, membrane-bound [Fructilactobacillus fructivorans]KRN42569.1 cell surface hydrolase, membrane-bound [Fructilactobacillus fructivorans]
MMKKGKLKWWHKAVIALVIIVIILIFVGTYFLFNFAFKRGGYSTQVGEKVNTTWIKKQNPQVWHQTNKSGLKLTAYYLPAKTTTNKTMIVVHGYGSTGHKMNNYIRMFHDDGYNVLAPDDESFGRSQGEYAGYGWKDRSDIVTWMNMIDQKMPTGRLGMFGISMGAAAVLFTLPKAPHNVDFAIADCGYNSIYDELKYELGTLFHLPTFPILPIARIYGNIFAKYDFYAANTKQTLAHNKIPLFIIHGNADKFVPVKDAYINYQNDHGPKKLWIVNHATHADSLNKEGHVYVEKTRAFSEQYFK